MDFIVTIGCGWRVSPPVNPLVAFFGVVSLRKCLHLGQSCTRRKVIIPVGVVRNVILLKPIFDRQFFGDIRWTAERTVFNKSICRWPTYRTNNIHRISDVRLPREIKQPAISLIKSASAKRPLHSDKDNSFSVLRRTIFKRVYQTKINGIPRLFHLIDYVVKKRTMLCRFP